MMKRAFYAAAACAALAATAVAIANDSTAEMTAGGLVLKNSRNIDMLEEDLFVSADAIRVSYVFRNQGRADESVIVAFPMPDRDLTDENESDVSHVRDFVTEVEAQRVQTMVERKAMLGRTDHTALLTGMGIPIAPAVPDPAASFDETFVEPTRAAIEKLSPADRNRLKRLKLIDFDESGDYLHLLWTVKETHYWRQTFPAGKDLRIRHSYVPGTGSSAGLALAYPEHRNSREGRADIREYCADREFLAGIDRMVRSGQHPQQQTVGYILKTGANWRSPIRSFRLVVDKGDPKNLVSFCGTGLTKISPTQFEMRRTNWRPTRDLRVLIALPIPPVTE